MNNVLDASADISKLDPKNLAECMRTASIDTGFRFALWDFFIGTAHAANGDCLVLVDKTKFITLNEVEREAMAEKVLHEAKSSIEQLKEALQIFYKLDDLNDEQKKIRNNLEKKLQHAVNIFVACSDEEDIGKYYTDKIIATNNDDASEEDKKVIEKYNKKVGEYYENARNEVVKKIYDIINDKSQEINKIRDEPVSVSEKLTKVQEIYKKINKIIKDNNLSYDNPNVYKILSKKASDNLRAEEGNYTTIYSDKDPKINKTVYNEWMPGLGLTIGIGHLIKGKKDYDRLFGGCVTTSNPGCFIDEKGNKNLTADKIEELFIYDILEASKAVFNNFKNTNLNQNQFDALFSFTYNYGEKNVLNSTFRSLIEEPESEYSQAHFNVDKVEKELSDAIKKLEDLQKNDGSKNEIEDVQQKINNLTDTLEGKINSNGEREGGYYSLINDPKRSDGIVYRTPEDAFKAINNNGLLTGRRIREWMLFTTPVDVNEFDTNQENSKNKKEGE